MHANHEPSVLHNQHIKCRLIGLVSSKSPQQGQPFYGVGRGREGGDAGKIQ